MLQHQGLHLDSFVKPSIATVEPAAPAGQHLLEHLLHAPGHSFVLSKHQMLASIVFMCTSATIIFSLHHLSASILIPNLV